MGDFGLGANAWGNLSSTTKSVDQKRKLQGVKRDSEEAVLSFVVDREREERRRGKSHQDSRKMCQTRLRTVLKREKEPVKKKREWFF